MSLDLATIDVEDLLEVLELRNVTVRDQEATFSCPQDTHITGDETPSCRMNVNTALLLCHSCGWRGTAVDLLAYVAGVTELEARRALRQRYTGFREPDGGLATEVERLLAPRHELLAERRRPSEAWLASCAWPDDSGPLDYMLARGFTREALDAYEVGYDHRSDRVVISVRDHHGALVGAKGRAWGDRQPKYLSLGDTPRGRQDYGFDTYRKSQFVYGLDKAGGVDLDRAILCEGEFNVVAIWQRLGVRALAVAGSEFSDRQRDLIVEHARSALIFFDDDEAGHRGAAKVAEALEPFISVSVAAPHEGDPATMSPQAIKAALDGARSTLDALV